MKVKIKLRSMSTSKGIARNGDIVDLPADEVKRLVAFRSDCLEVLPEKPKRKARK
jgi:hypothetical protein